MTATALTLTLFEAAVLLPSKFKTGVRKAGVLTALFELPPVYGLVVSNATRMALAFVTLVVVPVI